MTSKLGRSTVESDYAFQMKVKMFTDTTIPMMVDLKILKTLKIVPIFPLINELQRTINVATAGEDYDFSYVMNRVT